MDTLAGYNLSQTYENIQIQLHKNFYIEIIRLVASQKERVKEDENGVGMDASLHPMSVSSVENTNTAPLHLFPLHTIHTYQSRVSRRTGVYRSMLFTNVTHPNFTKICQIKI